VKPVDPEQFLAIIDDVVREAQEGRSAATARTRCSPRR
jgi:hypothetical protein